MRYSELIDRVQTSRGIDSREEAENLAKTTVEILGEALPADEMHRLEAHLPAELADALTRTWPGQDIDVEEFYDRISHREGYRMSYVRRQTRHICRELAQLLDADDMELLRQHLPPDIAELFEEESSEEGDGTDPTIDGRPTDWN